MYTYIPISPPSCVSLPPSLSHPSRWSQSTKLISLCYAVASHQLSILHSVVYRCQCYSLTSSQLTLPSPRVLKSIPYVLGCKMMGSDRLSTFVIQPDVLKYQDFTILKMASMLSSRVSIFDRDLYVLYLFGFFFLTPSTLQS